MILESYKLNKLYSKQLLLLFSCSVMSASLWLHKVLWTAAHWASLSFTISWSMLKLMSIESVMPSNHLTLCLPLLLPSVFSSIRVFFNELVLHIRWPKYWSFSFSNSPSNEHLGLTSFRMDWLDLLAVQGTLKSLLQHHSSETSILWHSAFFMIQLSHPYMTTGKTIALTRWTFLGKVMSLLFNTLSRIFIAFIPRHKLLLISWLQSSSAVTLEPKKIVCHCFHCFPIYFPWSDGTGCHDLSFWTLSFKPFFFTLLFHLHQEALPFLFDFCHKDSIIQISEVIDVSSCNLDSRLCFIQPSILHDVLCM